MERELAKTNYSFYCEYVHRGSYHHARHTEYICSKVQEVETGSIKKLMIFMPPQNGKSMTVSETFPSYYIAKNPDRRVIEISYGDSLARRFGRRNRQKIEEFGKLLFDVELSDDNASATNWSLKGKKGGMISAGLGGPITGEGANLIIIDDPIKNREEADSQTYRNRVWDEWQNTILTRLHPNGAVIIILTRWHEDDLAGRLLSQQPGEWTVISLPAMAEQNDLLVRQEGEPLWPEFGYDLEFLEQKKRDVGTRTWNALYQQRPSPEEGNIFKRHWWRYYTVPPKRFDEVIQSWDMAFKDTKSSSYVVGQVWGRIGADKYLLDQTRDRMNFVQTARAVEVLTEKWPQACAKLIEDKANGPAVISSLGKRISGLIPITPQGSKEARAAAVSPDVEAGNVFLPEARWVEDFIEECTSFPNAPNDDQVDAMSQALNRFSKRSIGTLDTSGLTDLKRESPWNL